MVYIDLEYVELKSVHIVWTCIVCAGKKYPSLGMWLWITNVLLLCVIHDDCGVTDIHI